MWKYNLMFPPLKEYANSVSCHKGRVCSFYDSDAWTFSVFMIFKTMYCCHM